MNDNTRTVDARLHLLDRQLVNADGDPVGIVDDLELDDIEVDRDIPAGTPAPRVRALLSGQALATRIFGGSPPRTRLHERPWQTVANVDVTVQLSDDDSPSDVHWVEQWLRAHIVGRIPGGHDANQ